MRQSVGDAKEREDLIRRLYDATVQHFRDIRVVEIDKMVQRAKSESKRVSVHDLAADIWDAAELEDATPLAEWLGRRPECDSAANIPEERPAILLDNPLFGDNTVYFGKGRKVQVLCQSRGQAEFVAALARLGVSGELKVAETHSACLELLKQIDDRMASVRARFVELAQSHTGDERIRELLMEVLQRWFVLGRKGTTE